MTSETLTYVRPVDPETGKQTYVLLCSAPLFPLVLSHQYDHDELTDQLCEDLTDVLRELGISHTSKIKHAHAVARAAADLDDDGTVPAPMVWQSVAAYLLDIEPDDEKLAGLLERGFYSEQTEADVYVEILTEKGYDDIIELALNLKRSDEEYEQANAARASASAAAEKAAADRAAARTAGMSSYFD